MNEKTPIWNWSKNADCVALPLSSSHVRGTSLTMILGEALFTMDPRLSIQSQMFLMDAKEGLALSTARVGLVAGDALLDINVIMDIGPTRKTPADAPLYFLEYRFAGEFYTRLDFRSHVAPITEWRTLKDTHARLTTILADKVLLDAAAGASVSHIVVSTAPGPVSAGGVLGWSGGMSSGRVAW